MHFLKFWGVAKGGFFSESAIRFSNLQISKKKKFQKAILSLKFKFPANNSKQQIQISSSGKYFGIFFLEIWRFEKRIALSEKKPPLLKVSRSQIKIVEQ